MKNLLTLAVFILLTGQTYAQPADNPAQVLTAEDEQAIIIDIREKYKHINDNLNTYSRKQGDIDAYSTEGGEYIAYYEPDNLWKIIATYYGETGKVVLEYYLWDNKVFFIFRQRFNYNSSIYNTEAIPEAGIEAFDDSKTVILENRYYFYQDKLIRWLDEEKKKADPASDAFREAEKYSLEDIAFILNHIQEDSEDGGTSQD